MRKASDPLARDQELDACSWEPLKRTEVTEARRTRGGRWPCAAARAKPRRRPDPRASRVRRFRPEPLQPAAPAPRAFRSPPPPRPAESGDWQGSCGPAARGVPFPPPPPVDPRRRRLEGALASSSGAQQVPRLPSPRRGERGRAGAPGRRRRRREAGSLSRRARPASQAGSRAHGFREAPEVR